MAIPARFHAGEIGECQNDAMPATGGPGADVRLAAEILVRLGKHSGILHTREATALLVEPMIDPGQLAIEPLDDSQPGIEARQPAFDALQSATQIGHVSLQAIELGVYPPKQRQRVVGNGRVAHRIRLELFAHSDHVGKV
jgi:hypothetical protein